MQHQVCFFQGNIISQPFLFRRTDLSWTEPVRHTYSISLAVTRLSWDNCYNTATKPHYKGLFDEHLLGYKITFLHPVVQHETNVVQL